MSLAADVYAALIGAGHPIVGVSIVDATVQATWTLQFAPGATAPQIAAANAALLVFDVVAWALAAAKVAKVEAVLGELRARNLAGFTHGGVVFRIDDGAIALIGLLQAAAPWPGGITIVAADDSPVAFNTAQLATFADAVATMALARQVHARNFRVAIAAAATQAALDAIDLTAGWP
jgi:hypothetical protein